MIILGIGIDIVAIKRVEKLWHKHKSRVIKRVLSQSEIEYMNNSCTTDKIKMYFLAKRFAMKEAIVKAIGSGITQNITWSDIVIKSNKDGKPYVEKTDRLIEAVRKLHIISRFNIFVSVADETDYVVANALLQEKDPVEGLRGIMFQ